VHVAGPEAGHRIAAGVLDGEHVMLFAATRWMEKGRRPALMSAVISVAVAP
jgi:hypothetical protein